MRLAEPDNVVNCLCLNEAALHYILINDLLCREFSESWWECFWQHYLDWICKDIIQAVIVSFSSPLFYLSKTTVIYFCKAIRIYYMCLALLNIVLHRRTAFWPCIIMFVFQGNCCHAKTNVLKEKMSLNYFKWAWWNCYILSARSKNMHLDFSALYSSNVLIRWLLSLLYSYITYKCHHQPVPLGVHTAPCMISKSDFNWGFIFLNHINTTDKSL